MKLHTASRDNVKIKIGIQGAAGSGKSKSGLLLAYGLVGDWSKVAVIDTENRSSELYSHLGPFNVLPLMAPFTPERFREAILTCINAGMEVIIIDSISSEWQTILQEHSSLTGNSYTNWSKFTPRHQLFVDTIVHANVHIICTLRSKQAYVINERNGKLVPEKVGMKPVQRDDMDYELSLVFQLSMQHRATVIKDRTEMFSGASEFRITIDTGKRIKGWCEQESTEQELIKSINDCSDIPSLKSIFEQHPIYQESLRIHFNNRKQQLLTSNGQHINN